ncbi:MAG: helix-turn-helix domain-containing protein [candidate division Zixibacteria bacterium]
MKTNETFNLPDKEYFTTGETAAMCAVTANTVLKWVVAGKIPAARTPGGHHRIPRSAIMELIKNKEPIKSMGSKKPVVSRNNKKAFQYCWEFNSQGGKLPEGCKNCIVYRSRTGRCYEIAGLGTVAGHAGVFCQNSCDKCEYYEAVRNNYSNVLVVTDKPGIREALEVDKKQANFKLEFSDCEYRCSMMVDKFEPDYIVVDCSMGQKRSREFAQHLSVDPRIPYARIILGGGESEIPSECNHLVFAFLKRPFSIKAISDLIDGLHNENEK